MLTVLLLVNTALTGVGVFGLVRRWPSIRRANGRHVTRPLRRRVGAAGARLVRLALIVLVFAADFAGFRLVDRTGLIVYWLWLIDDIYFSDDDERKRWDWVKVKLRKWKPVMQRLAQQWKPRAPKVPVPA